MGAACRRADEHVEVFTSTVSKIGPTGGFWLEE